MSENPDHLANRALVPPLDSPAREEARHLGEALLTQDGRITDTPQAKTIAIEELARRLRAPTPALILASMGLVVGSDMDAHRGSSQHVLVPHHAGYPSMGVDLRHIDDLDSTDPRRWPTGTVRMDTPQAEALIRQVAVSELMGAWSYGSNNNVRVLALQQAAQEEFGITDALDWHLAPRTRAAVDIELDYNRNALRAFLRTQHDMTQEVLAARGITEVIGYRALSWPEGAEQPLWASADHIGTIVEARSRPLASWSADRQIVADWLEQRSGPGVIVAARQPAQTLLSLPSTGMGFFDQKEWVAMPGDHRVTLDGIVSHSTPAPDLTRTAAAAVSLGAPALQSSTDPDALPSSATTAAGAADRWRPPSFTGTLDPANPLDAQIMRILAKEEDPTPWWPQDDSGYAIAQRDLDFLGITPIQLKWFVTGEAPLGMTPQHHAQFGTEMLTALEHDGIDPAGVDIRLKGSGSGFFSGLHKTLPREEGLTGNLPALQRLHEWFQGDPHRPVRRPFDSMWKLGLDAEPSDFDLDINSTSIVWAAREHWRANHADRYPGDFMGGHGYLDKATLLSTLPALAHWARSWENRLGRPLSLGAFESSGPFDNTQLGRPLSSHFQETDWIIHNPARPEAWRTPRSHVTPPEPEGPAPAPRSRPSAAAARSRSTTVRKPAPGQKRPTQGTEQPSHLRRRPGPEQGRGPNK
ncbi:hypothetical protein [Streptomyces sp. VB1]|uniref:hypothetical protein n=1 Tax=Streptomyces sp. VB1 TaxID=2986803 RepID=UPI00224287D0|nr:hypothetical protein [Streptomyces sp. VB1]UZI34048.1 hypothetical protein OH133_38660 [Streptomyces sp. VB1]